MSQAQLPTGEGTLPAPAWRAHRPGTRNGHGGSQHGVTLARSLGWFGIGLGMVELVAPRRLTQSLGLDRHDTLLRLCGLREVASGVGILSQPRPTAGIWSRVGGDLVDLALLTAALGTSARRGRVAGTLAAVGGVTLLDLLAGDRLARRSPGKAASAPADGSIELTESISVAGTPKQAYGFWRQLENLPRFMAHLRDVQQTGERRSHWVAAAPGGGSVAWDAEIVNEVPGELIAWRSIDGADVENSGTVRFSEDRAGRGTQIDVELRYRPPMGGAGALVAKLFGEEPGQQLKADLRRLKQVLETGEVATTEGQSSGRVSRDHGARAARGEVQP